MLSKEGGLCQWQVHPAGTESIREDTGAWGQYPCRVCTLVSAVPCSQNCHIFAPGPGTDHWVKVTERKPSTPAVAGGVAGT